MVLISRTLDPTPPVDIADAVEAWARSRGAHARIVWVAPIACFAVKFTLPASAKANLDVQEGRAAEATEMVPLHEWDGEQGQYVALRLEDYGASGIINMLERLDTKSGRGLYDGMQAAIAATRVHNEQVAESARKAADEVAREAADRGRSAMKIPFFRVGIDLNRSKEG